MNKIFPALLVVAFFLLLIFITKNQSIGDFGNYYYGSKIFSEKGNVDLLYNDIHDFNEAIKTYGEINFFENYTPVPPFSILFYYPFIFLKATVAKFLFNILASIFLAYAISIFLKTENKNDYRYLLSVPLLIVPIYYNYAQGQCYTFITALLLITWVAYKKRRYILVAACIAIIFHLKIFPAFILVFFVFKKEYRVVAYTLVIITVLAVLTAMFVGSETVLNYYTQIVPRLFKNEVVDPFYYGHQSIHILFQNMFRYDSVYNPSPFIDMPVIIPMLEGTLVALGFYLIYEAIKNKSDASSYGLVIFLMIFVNKYLPSYSLLMVLPFIICSLDNRRLIIPMLILVIACNIPPSLLNGFPWVIKYSRSLLLIITFIILFSVYKPHVHKLRLIAMVLVFISFFTLAGRADDNFYLEGTEQKGVYYDMKLENGHVILSRCMGNKDIVDTLLFTVVVKSVEHIDSHPLITQNQKIKKAYLINNDMLLYLSDFQQGIGMYKPRLQEMR